MKKFLVSLLCAVTFVCAIGFSACTTDKGNDDNRPTQSEEDGDWTDNY